MSLKDEISVFNKAKLSASTGETEVWDRVIYPHVIRKREIEIILGQIEQVKPRRVLDFGCGAGWLSKFLSSKGYHCVGVDASSSLIKSAITSSSNNSQFVIGDCMSLPFQDGSFDFVVGIGILHHLDPKQGLAECYRVLSRKGTLILMEPNKFSPLAALGRRIAPLDTHTPGEQPLSSTELKHILLRTGWIVEHTGYIFPYSFALAQVLRKTKLDRQGLRGICAPVEASERLFEKIPFLNSLSWTIFVEAKKKTAMNILQVVHYFKPFWSSGGPARVCYEIARRLADMGHEVTIYSNEERRASEEKVIKNQPTTVDGMTVWYFKNLSNYLSNKTNIDSPYLLLFLARNNLKEFDVIHIHTFRSILAIPIWYYAKKYGIPYVLQAHGSVTTFFYKGWLKRIFDRLWGYKILKDAAKVIASTKTEAGQYKSTGVDENKIEIVPNGINLPEYENLPERGEFRRKYGLDDNARVVLYLGRIHKIKGLDLLARAFAELSKDVDNVKLVFVGPDNGYLPSLKKLVGELKINDKVLFTGPLYGEDKLKAYVDADIYVLPSFYETFPNTVFEACACGTPVILTDRCGIADVINSRAGLVVPYDKERLQQALLRILGDDKLRREFGEKGKLMLREKFNWEKIANQVESIYSNCILLRHKA